MGIPGAVSRAATDDSAATLKTAEAGLMQAQAAQTALQQRTGITGATSLATETAANRLEQALLSLSYTMMRAPEDGVVKGVTMMAGLC
ncbi:hypothetical protein ACNJNU_05040 [Citrobacter freundii]|uniref:hypothetical protein n=1 Tax=Citrobacter freundii TaxID=546 RepID=UPI003A8AA850